MSCTDPPHRVSVSQSFLFILWARHPSVNTRSYLLTSSAPPVSFNIQSQVRRHQVNMHRHIVFGAELCVAESQSRPLFAYARHVYSASTYVHTLGDR